MFIALLNQFSSKLAQVSGFGSAFNKGKAGNNSQQSLQCWEYHTLLGGELLSIGEQEAALDHFQQSWQVANRQLKDLALSEPNRGQFVDLFALAVMNVCYILHLQGKSEQLEKILSDGHFRLLAMMSNQGEPTGLRHLAQCQAKQLLKELTSFLSRQGRNKVADSLQNEFSRLELSLDS